MIIRLMGEGQFRVDESRLEALNVLDEAVAQAVEANDQEALGVALRALSAQVREHGVTVADDELVESDLIIPAGDATLDEVRALLSEGREGLIPD